MTTQSSESIIYGGQKYLTRTCPLEVYFRLGGIRPPFIVNTTMCWRGYSCLWSLEEGQLRLSRISGLLALGEMIGKAGNAYRHSDDYSNNPDLCRAVTLDDLFPGYGERIFAHWYSGQIIAASANHAEPGLVATVRRGIVEQVKPITEEVS